MTEHGKPRGFYYGWIVVLCASLAMAATLPGRTHGLGLITKRLLADFPTLSEASFAQLNLVATLVGALFCLPCGWLLDRFGSRRVALCTMLALAAIVLWLAQVKDETTLAVAITLTRGVGQSMLSVISITMIGRWFQRNLSMAMGTFAVVMTFLLAAATGVLGARVIAVGWRGAWWEMGWVLLGCAFVVGIFSRSAPSELSHEFLAQHTGENKRRLAASATLWQALCTPCFWVFAGSISFFGLVSAGISLFQQFILEERGLDERMFHIVLVIGLLVGMIANLAAGGLAKFVRLQSLLAFGMLLLAASLAVLPFVHTPVQAYLYAVGYGVAGGFITVMFFGVWGHAFGESHLGRIQGAAQMLTVVASAFGPVLVAGSHHSAKSYDAILWQFAAISAVFGVAAVFTPVPNAARGAWEEENSTAGDSLELAN